MSYILRIVHDGLSRSIITASDCGSLYIREVFNCRPACRVTDAFQKPIKNARRNPFVSTDTREFRIQTNAVILYFTTRRVRLAKVQNDARTLPGIINFLYSTEFADRSNAFIAPNDGVLRISVSVKQYNNCPI